MLSCNILGMEISEIEDLNKDKPVSRKQIVMLIAAFCVLCFYFALSWMIDIRFASKEEERYSKELLSKAQTAGDILSARVKNLSSALNIFRRVYLTEFATEKRGLGSVIDLFEEELNSFPELLSLSYMNATAELVYARGIEGDEGEAAVNASIDWTKEYWSRIGPDDEKPFYTPLKLSGGNYLQGILFPVALEDKIAGGLIAVIDAGTVGSKSFELVDIPEGASIFLMDMTGKAISSLGKADNKSAPDVSFATKEFMDKARSSQNGCQFFKVAVTDKAGKRKSAVRMNIAWQQAMLGSKDTIIAIVSPAEDSIRLFRKARLTHMLLEFLFAVAVSIAITIFLIEKRKEQHKSQASPD
jgi:uncharacterized protein YpmS